MPDDNKEHVITKETVVVDIQPNSSFWSNPQTYRDIGLAINNGAFAVLLVTAIIFWFTRRFVSKAVDSYQQLLDTLQKSVSNNSKAIDRLADSQTRLVDILFEFKHSPYATRLIKELEGQITALRDANVQNDAEIEKHR